MKIKPPKIQKTLNKKPKIVYQKSLPIYFLLSSTKLITASGTRPDILPIRGSILPVNEKKLIFLRNLLQLRATRPVQDTGRFLGKRPWVKHDMVVELFLNVSSSMFFSKKKMESETRFEMKNVVHLEFRE